jgi:putative peptidoglycan lipid II flippase
MIVGTGLSRITGFLRIFALGYAFGLTPLSDAYNIANTTPNIIFDLVVGGVLSGTIVPVFVRAIRRRDEEADWDAVSAVCTLVAVTLIVLSLVFVIAVPTLVKLYTLGLHGPAAASERRLAADLLYLFVPQVILYGGVTLMTAVLNARRRFAAPAFAPVLNNVVVIAAVLITRAMVHKPAPTVDDLLHSNAARLTLGLGTTAGVLAMAAAMVPSLRAAGPRLRWYWKPRHPAIRTVLRLSGWTAGFVVANQLALLVVNILANQRHGDLTAYSYAYVLFLLPHGIFAVSVMSAVEPELAQRWSVGDVAGYRQQLVEGVRLVAAIIVPAALGYATLGQPIVRLVLEHGSVLPVGAQRIADILALMALGLPAFSIYLLLMRAYQAMQDTRSMFLTYLVENALNIALAALLYPYFGVMGLAAAWSLAYVGGTIVAIHHLGGRIGGLGSRSLNTVLYRIAVAAVTAVDVAMLTSLLIAHLLGTGSALPLFLRVSAAVIVGVTVYVHVARRFGIDEVRSLLRPRRNPV